MTHVLIDAATGAPVPLPYYCEDLSGNFVSIFDYVPETDCTAARVAVHNRFANRIYLRPDQVGLAIITEEEFMRRQEDAQ